jgi:hypothetical protein
MMQLFATQNALAKGCRCQGLKWTKMLPGERKFLNYAFPSTHAGRAQQYRRHRVSELFTLGFCAAGAGKISSLGSNAGKRATLRL